MQSKSSSTPRSPHTPIFELVIVLAAVIISQVAAVAILGATSSTTSTSTTTSCWVNLFGLCLGQSQQVHQNPGSSQAANLASAMIPWFVLLDAILIGAIVYVLVTSSGRRGRSGRELGAGRSRGRAR